VRKKEVSLNGAQGNEAIVTSGLTEGEIIATAGLPFLLDGMKVNIFKPRIKDNLESGTNK